MRKRLIILLIVGIVWGGAGLSGAGEIDPSLIGWWEFEDGSGTVAADSSGRSVDGALFGNPVWDTSGRHRGVLVLDGTDDYVFIDGLFKLPVYTMTVWFRVDASGQRDILSAYAVGVQHGILLELQAAGTLRYLHRYPLGTGGGTNVYTTATYDDGAWYHAAIVKSEDMIALYVNGEEVGTAADNSVFDPADSFGLAVGVLDDERGTARLFLGPMDDVRIYDRVLSAEEIAVAMKGRPYAPAYDPAPEDGSMLAATSTMLRWVPGDFAASHDVYLGESFDAVNEATPEDDVFVGNQVAAASLAQDLVPGKTYYWRVDEVNDADPESPWKGEVWSFWVQPIVAWNPSPADGVPYVRFGQHLSWNAGMGALFHTVYFGESFDEIKEATTGGWMIVDPTYDPGPLKTETAYYWRVDEFAGMATNKGDVWSFTTVPEIAVTDPTLVGWWTLDEGVGATAVDWSGHGNHGAILGKAQWDPDGIDRGCLMLDGATNYVVVEGTRESNIVLAQYTMAVWFRADRTGGPRDLIAAYLDGPAFGTLVELTADSTMRFLHRSITGGTGADLATTETYDDGGWHHVAIVKTENELIGYIDGEVAASAATDDVYDDSFYVSLGILDHLRANDRFFPGPIDDARIYDRALTVDEIQQIMRGDPLLAWNPEPARRAVVDIREATSLSWSPGDTAASHDVYFGTSRDAVAAAGTDSAEYQGNQAGTSLSLAGLVEFAGGDYFWRIDEVEAGGAVHAGNIWTFTVPPYLIVDDFESYTDNMDDEEAVFQTWIDGWENNTGSTVGYLQSAGGTFGETQIVNSGGQSMPLAYDNTMAPWYAETERTWPTPQDWMIHDANTLTLYFRGAGDNTPDDLYVALEDSGGTVGVAIHSDPNAVLMTEWTSWPIPFSAFGAVDASRVKKMYIGLGDRDNPAPGGAGLIYIDDIRATKP